MSQVKLGIGSGQTGEADECPDEGAPRGVDQHVGWLVEGDETVVFVEDLGKGRRRGFGT